MLGPLYHLRNAEDRGAALAEAKRIVRPGGVVYAAAISRWAPRLDGMIVQRINERYPIFGELVDEVEATGAMPPIHESAFTGYTHRPDQLREEVQDARLRVESLVAVEGIAFALPDVTERLDDPVNRAYLYDMLRPLESVPELLGLGPHLLVTANSRS